MSNQAEYRCACGCKCNAVLTPREAQFYERNLDVYPRWLCGKCWNEMRATHE